MNQLLPEITHRTLTTTARSRVHVADTHRDGAGGSDGGGDGGGDGGAVLLVHGFPETWWTFRGLFGPLADRHRVVAVDLPGFGDSEAVGPGTSEQAAAVLAEVVEQLDAGPVHLLGQDVSGAPTYRLAAARPDLVASWTAIETVLPGFGFDALADAAHGGAWYIGMLAAPGAAELLLPGRERAFLGEQVLRPQMTEPLDEDDLAEFTRAYARPGGFAGAADLYRSLLAEGPALQSLAASPLTMPVLTVSGSAGDFVPMSLRNVAPHLEHVTLPGVGHYVALEAPAALAETLLPFLASTQK